MVRFRFEKAINSPAVMERITNGYVAIKGNRDEVPNADTASHDHEKEAQETPLLVAAKL
jgi:hypothetical protein